MLKNVIVCLRFTWLVPNTVWRHCSRLLFGINSRHTSPCSRDINGEKFARILPFLVNLVLVELLFCSHLLKYFIELCVNILSRTGNTN